MRCYRLLLLLYPASFRREYGAEMTADFVRRLEAASSAPQRRADAEQQNT